MKQSKKQYVKKGMIGLDMGIGLGMSAISTVTSMIQANKIKKEEERARKLALQNNFNGAVIEQDVYNNQFQKDNINDLPVYAKGGNMNNTNKLSTMGEFDTTGGDLVPISNNAEVVVGNKHTENKVDGSYGVTLSKDGQPIANIEDDEVVVNDRLVFSDKLKKGNETFADIALKVNTKIGELQETLKTAKKPSEKFSIERTITGLEKQNDNLFKEQELVKQNTFGDTEEVVAVENGVVAKGEGGMDLKKYAPLIPLAADNITNLILTSKSPKPAPPITRRAPILDTTVNVNPALAEIKNSINAGNEVVSNNTNSSSVARANITANNLRGIQASANVLAAKDAQEIQLKNNQNTILANTANANAALNEQYLADVYQNQLEKNASTSANISNLVEDFTAVQKDINAGNKEESILELDALRDPTGQTKRDLANSAAIMKKNKQAILEAKREAKRRAIENDLKY